MASLPQKLLFPLCLLFAIPGGTGAPGPFSLLPGPSFPSLWLNRRKRSIVRLQSLVLAFLCNVYSAVKRHWWWWTLSIWAQEPWLSFSRRQSDYLECSPKWYRCVPIYTWVYRCECVIFDTYWALKWETSSELNAFYILSNVWEFMIVTKPICTTLCFWSYLPFPCAFHSPGGELPGFYSPSCFKKYLYSGPGPFEAPEDT